MTAEGRHGDAGAFHTEHGTRSFVEGEGPDVGSPSIRLESTGNAIFGPIVDPAPLGDVADAMLKATVALLEVPEFFELKRSRTAAPDFS